LITSKDANFQFSVVGECKWSENKMGVTVFYELEEKVLTQKLPLATHCRYFLFNISGFTSELEELAGERNDIVLERGLNH
jgi:hypothetical protein